MNNQSLGNKGNRGTNNDDEKPKHSTSKAPSVNSDRGGATRPSSSGKHREPSANPESRGGSKNPANNRSRSVSKPAADRESSKPSTSEPLAVDPRSQGAGYDSVSPTNYISMEEMMKAADTYTNLSLAHEIAVDNNFCLQKQELPENSLEKKVRDTMLQAFWDILREELNSTPPKYTQALNLLQEIKDTLLSFLTSRNVTMQKHIDEHLDIDLIRQQLEHGALNLKSYSDYVIDTMGKMCAPMRDEDVAQLRKIEEPVQLFSEIFRVLDLMKMDMANFTIAQMRPYIQKNAVEYEKKKFQEFIQAQKNAGLGELEITHHWLSTACKRLQDKAAEKGKNRAAPPAPSKTQASTSSTSGQGAKGLETTASDEDIPVTPFNILIEACMGIMDWPDIRPYPETLQMDENRLRTLREAVHHVILTASLILITGNVLQQSGCKLSVEATNALKNTLKDHIIALMRKVLTCHFPQHDQSLYLQIVKDVNAALQAEKQPLLSSASEAALKQQVADVTTDKNPVSLLLRKRLYQFIRVTVFASNPQQPPQEVPKGFSIMQPNILEICGHLMRLFTYNRAVYGPIYAEILQPLVNPRDISPANTPVEHPTKMPSSKQ